MEVELWFALWKVRFRPRGMRLIGSGCGFPPRCVGLSFCSGSFCCGSFTAGWATARRCPAHFWQCWLACRLSGSGRDSTRGCWMLSLSYSWSGLGRGARCSGPRPTQTWLWRRCSGRYCPGTVSAFSGIPVPAGAQRLSTHSSPAHGSSWAGEFVYGNFFAQIFLN